MRYCRQSRTVGIHSTRALRALMGLTAPASLLRVSPTLPMAQDPVSTPWGHQPLPQQHHSRTGLQLLTTLLCPALGLAEPGPQPVLASSHPRPRPQGGAQCRGLCCPWCPQLSCSWLGPWDRPGLPGPALLPHEDPYGGPQGALAPSSQVLSKASGLGSKHVDFEENICFRGFSKPQ